MQEEAHKGDSSGIYIKSLKKREQKVKRRKTWEKVIKLAKCMKS